MNKTYISRKEYIEQIQNYKNTDLIKVLIGQRRVWKSYILIELIDTLKRSGVREDEIIFINKEDLEWDMIKNYADLYERVKDHRYIFIDEIQDITDWEKAIRSLQSSGGHDIYITGSNSNLLSSELSTFLSGRYVSFYIQPLNYTEFLTFHDIKDSEESFLKYIKFWWLPYLKNLKLEEEIVYGYLKDVVNTILLKDVISRNKIRNIEFYRNLIIYLASEVGSIFSAKSLSDYLKNQKIGLSPNVVLNYLENSVHASFLNKISRYDLKGKRLFEILQKYYFTDIGIRNVLVWGYSKIHISWILENVVYCNMISHGWEVTVGEYGEKEVDFVCRKNGNIMYLQVAYLLESEKTRKREFSALQSIPDSWKKYVITMDIGASWSIDGIAWVNIRDFLLRVL
jgi:predicted AAA+ superfamily ATPase